MMILSGITNGLKAALLKTRGARICLIVLFAAWSGAGMGGEGNVINIVCTTTHLKAVVDAVGGVYVEAYALVPFGMCPGHFDVSPREAERVRNAEVVLAHGYERFLDGFGPEISGGTGGRIKLAEVKGNWMIPDVHKTAAVAVAKILIAARPGSKKNIMNNLSEYESRIDAAILGLKDIREFARGKSIVAAEMNRDFAEWMGMNVVAVLPRDEDVSVRTMNELICLARLNKAALVADNRQSGGKTGETIARELNLPMVVLNNFPEITDADGPLYPYIATLQQNCAVVKEGLSVPGK